MHIKSSYRFQHIEQYIKLKIKKKNVIDILNKMGQVYNNNKIYQSHQFKRARTHTFTHSYTNI